MNVKIGCSGFQEARTKYYSEFPLVELQQSFFQPPPLGTVAKWRKMAPENFEFTVKAWQLITHEPASPSYQKLREKLPFRALRNCGFFNTSRMVFEAWNRTEAVAGVLKAKTIVFQSSKNFQQNPENIKKMKNFFRKINRKQYVLVWEPPVRWSLNVIQSLCEELNLVYTGDPFAKNPPAFGPIRYFRLRGKRGYNSRYDQSDYKKLLTLTETDIPTYFVFNNSAMLYDSRNFLKYVTESQKQLAETESGLIVPVEKKIVAGDGTPAADSTEQPSEVAVVSEKKETADDKPAVCEAAAQPKNNTESSVSE